MKVAHIVLTVAPTPRVPIDKNVHHCPVNKSASGPLTLIDLYGSFQGHECDNLLYLPDGATYAFGCYETHMGIEKSISDFQNPNTNFILNDLDKVFQDQERENRM